MNLVKLTHASLKTPMYVNMDQVISFMAGEAGDYTFLWIPYSSADPKQLDQLAVLEKPEQIIKLINKGENNG